MQLAVIDPPRKFLQKSTWWKKELAEFHVDLLRYCGYGCKYCSTNAGCSMIFMGRATKESIRQQLGHEFDPIHDGHVTIGYGNPLAQIEHELKSRNATRDHGRTVVYSELTDGFSANLVSDGIARRALELLLIHTSLRIRVLTKNAVIGQQEWIDFFLAHRERFVVGLSIGTLDDQFAASMESGTSPPSERIKAHRRLQDAGVSTFGMMCPVFPQVVGSAELERLADSLRPHLCERIWFEPYNSRRNWQLCRDVYEGHSCRTWFTEVYENRRMDLWSEYAGYLYRDMRRAADAGGWTDKLRYLLYEKDFASDHIHLLGDHTGILFQSPTGEHGLSKNEAIRDVQLQIARGIVPSADTAVAFHQS